MRVAADLPAARVGLHGREPECAAIGVLLDGARAQRSGTLALLGEAGIGKSALCAWAVARADGMQVLTIRGIESEADLPFAGLAELCADHGEVVRRLPEPQAGPLEAALARRARPAGDRFAVGAAVLGLLALLAERTPVLLAVDDAQWVDGASMDALLFAARRLRREGVAVLLAGRPAAQWDVDAAAIPSLQVGALDPGASRELLRAAHDDLPAPVADVLVEAAGGIPLALLEIPRMLHPAQRSGRTPIEPPLPLGPTLERALAGRVVALPAATLEALLVAAASDTARLQPVLDAMACLRPGADASALEPAERAGVVVLAGEGLSFAHPLLRSAVYHRAPEPERRAAHRALAHVSAGDARAWHLARAAVGEDEELAALLEDVGLRARTRGAPGAAAAALQRAARLTAPGPERSRRLAAAAGDAYVAGREAAAVEMLDEATRWADGPVRRADIARVRGRILVLHGEARAAYRLLVDAAEAVRATDPEAAAALLAEACLDCLAGADVPAAVAVAEEAVRVADGAGPAVGAFAACVLATSLALSGEAGRATALIDEAAPLLLQADPLTEAGAMLAQTAQCCVWLERHEHAVQLLERLIGAARAGGAPAALPWPLVTRADLNERQGRWDLVTADAEEALVLAEQTRQLAMMVYALDRLARVAAARGQEDACRRHVARALDLVERHRVEPGRAYLRATLGLLELGLGRMPPALAHLEAAEMLSRRHGVAEPRVLQWQADLVEAQVRVGDHEAAALGVEELARAGRRSGGRWTLGAAARGRGLLAPAGEARACFDVALGHFEAASAPFEVARTQLCRGEWLRRAGLRTEARPALAAAVDGFDRLGAAPWAARGRRELAATGATSRRRAEREDRDALTAHELQVASVVAAGATNREAAAALFLSPKTVEFHLSHIYRKLGVRSRAELAALAAREEGLARRGGDGSRRE